MTGAVNETKPARTPIRYGWASITIAVIFGILYAYVLWGAIGNLVGLSQLDVPNVPWALLILDIGLPVVVFAAAFWLGRHRSWRARLLIYVVGLALLACCTVGSFAYSRFV